MGEGVSGHYLGEAGRRYAEARLISPVHTGYRENFKLFLPHLRAEDCVLEFGCGAGQMLPLLASAVRSVEAVEVNPTGRSAAREHGMTVHASLDEIPAQTRYDAVVSSHVLEHIADVPTVLQAIRARLAPGGRFVTLLPYDDIRSKRQRSWSKDDVDRHLHTWTPRLLGNVLMEGGFEVQAIRVVTSAWSPRLFGLRPAALRRLCFRLVAIVTHRRQVFAVGTNPR